MRLKPTLTGAAMTTDTIPTPTATNSAGEESVRIHAHSASVKKLGHWTAARRLEVRASRGSVVLDLLLARIDPGDIEITLDIDRTTVKLLVPDGAIIDDSELRRVGRGRVKDWTGTAAPGGRRIRLLGEMRGAEVRVHRGGVAILSLLRNRNMLEQVRDAHRDGRLRQPRTA
jgi:hypothetical protein